MATFLMCWELGGGLGHLASLRPVAIGLKQRGHRVVVAAANLPAARQWLPDFEVLPAPIHALPRGQAIAEPSTFADILANAGCRDRTVLAELVSQWREIFQQVQPQVVVMDFSPLALVALQGWPTRRVLLGFGHACPTDETPLVDLCPWRNNYPDRLLRTEAAVLDALNGQLAAQGEPALARVGQLYTRVHANLLTTFAELDHYQHRPTADYRGVLGVLPGETPPWPAGQRPRVLVYLKPLSSTRFVLTELARRGYATLAHVPQFDPAEFRAESLSLSTHPLDLQRLAPECDVAILNAGHNATAQMLLAGKPALLLPISGEQQVVSLRATELGAAVWVSAEDRGAIARGLDTLTGDERYAQAARRFTARYADFDRQQQLAGILDSLESQLTASSA